MIKGITAVFFGVFLYVGLILVHEEWEERYMMGVANRPSAINLNQPWILVALIAGAWVLLVALARYAERHRQLAKR